MTNPLIDDRLVDFLLHELVDISDPKLVPPGADHDVETYSLYLAGARRLAREKLFPTYRAMDLDPPELVDGRVVVHPSMQELWPLLVDLGCLAATRPEDVGGQDFPHTVQLAATAYLMAGNLCAYGYAGLTTGAAHLIEAFGSDALKETYLERMYDGTWTGTMALTEPDAGSGLGDLRSTAKPNDDGSYSLRGSKIFISGGDQNFTDNVVHLMLARIEGAPSGTKGISLFVVPRVRPDGTHNDVSVAGVIHKIGWKGLPSLALNFGERGECKGWLVGEANRGLRYMFQMMNEARLMVGVNAVATSSAAYHESLRYARERRQGRTWSDPKADSAVSIIEHPDVRRMLLRQKAIFEGSFGLVLLAGRYADIARSSEHEAERTRAELLLDLLTPVAKTYPSEKGFDATALAVQILGGYGYTNEYLPESYLRDQKLNTIHEGTTGIQSLDLLGRKVMAKNGAALRAFQEEVNSAATSAHQQGLDVEADALTDAMKRVGALTMELGMKGMKGDVESMLSHSADYLELFGTFVMAWTWLRMMSAAKSSLDEKRGDEAFLRGLLQAGRYYFATELPRIEALANLVQSGERSYLDMQSDWF